MSYEKQEFSELLQCASTIQTTVCHLALSFTKTHKFIKDYM